MTSGSSRHKKALGKGLSALLPDSEVPGTGLGTSVMLRSDLIDSNPYQPRRVWDETELEALAGSIRAAGLLQPLIVRKKGARFQLIAGERRLRAARLAGLASVPAIVRDASEQEMLALALIENIQRRDLGPIEKAEAFRRLSEEFSLSQEQLAECVGMSRPAVA
ncbi:ParB/RepB/Spo0J family partition protein, partial [Candidatus Fermentibacterales bacterium]|nr:ParB/RepB/Spo0J family partition protein [Candidatus Fermentibacterales bacterium]